MTRWDYLVLDFKISGGNYRPWQINGQEIRNWTSARTFDVLTQLGNDGWEMVAAQASQGYETLYFKRPKA